ncbi:hypothetical protein E4U42_004506 [Claviceps africana]|uniref:Uncharacterized protein n=1 Tax=Claviceps africana TaxID=83212 RepID=A0A8K0J561_9HYPO|nr:hypothetical protein E4U42_004506 [Claviceps africana]
MPTRRAIEADVGLEFPSSISSAIPFVSHLGPLFLQRDLLDGDSSRTVSAPVGPVVCTKAATS